MQQRDRQRLERMLDYCREIDKTLARYGAAFEVFEADADYQRSVSFSIFQIGELSIGLSEEFREQTAEEIPWHAIRGMRNMVAHNYGSMNRRVIWETARTDIPVIRAFCRRMLDEA